MSSSEIVEVILPPTSHSCWLTQFLCYFNVKDASVCTLNLVDGTICFVEFGSGGMNPMMMAPQALAGVCLALSLFTWKLLDAGLSWTSEVSTNKCFVVILVWLPFGY